MPASHTTGGGEGAKAPAAPPRSERPAFWRRHRQAILTACLVLYTLVLAVGVADDVFHLGLFPTKLERRARSLIADFDGPPEVRARAAARLVREVDSFVAVPALLDALDSASLQRRALAAECLRHLTKVEQGFDPEAPPADRRAAIQRWRDWWAEHKYRY
ncbi:MAG: hypothetical protein ACLF0G_06790 [Candidatus Brocadiia bacterium]